ncbi:uncharacterized protein LOC133905469 isoform X2 [Phragmites australis]|uniref:uncharacterized protein LOC133905469 isoform X2 n=1 Tax=Phragmites australis TaxID=29695 RepID=UPI002D784402|nr:uncharacterized protein LOC133905469 isoform X2 [Phragmites australis]
MAPKRQLFVAAGAGTGAEPPPGKRVRVAEASGSSPETPSSPRKRFLAIVLVVLFFKRPKGRSMDSVLNSPSQIGRLVMQLGQILRLLNTIVRQQESIKEWIQGSHLDHHNHEQLTQETNQQWISAESKVLATKRGEGKSTSIRLRFLNGMKTPVYHDDEIKSESNGAIKIGIFDGDKMIKSAPLSNAKIEILALEGNFPYDAMDSWTAKEFDEHIARGRDGKGNVLAGKGTTAQLINGERDLGSIKFTEGSCMARNRMFIVGARVMEGERAGVRVQEAVMKPVAVKVPRNKSNEKSHPPKLDDEVYRLEEIAKHGKYRKRLEEMSIFTVQDFLKALNKDSDNLARILKIKKENKAWEKMIGHAKECRLEGKHKLKLYTCAEKNAKLFFNCVHRLVGAAFSGGRYTPFDKFNPFEQSLVDKLKEGAYSELDVLPEDHVKLDNSSDPIHMDTYAAVGAGPSYMSSATQQNWSGRLAAHQVGGMAAVEGLIHGQIEPSCANANNDPGPSFSIPDHHSIHNYQGVPAVEGLSHGQIEPSRANANNDPGPSSSIPDHHSIHNYQVGGIPAVEGFSHGQIEPSCANVNNGPGASFSIPDHLGTHNYQDQWTWLAGQEQFSPAFINDLYQDPLGGHGFSFETTGMSNMRQFVSHEDDTNNYVAPGLGQLFWPDNDTVEASTSARINTTLTQQQLTVIGAPGSAQGIVQRQMEAPLPPNIGAPVAPASAQRTLSPQQWSQCQGNTPWNGSL